MAIPSEFRTESNIVREIERLTLEKQIIIDPEREARNVYLVRQPDGSYVRTIGDLNPYNVALEDLGSLLTLCHEEAGHKKAVYVGFSAIKVVDRNLEKKTQRVYTLALKIHPLFAWADSHHPNPKRYSQKDLVLLLRLQLRGTVAPSVATTIQNISYSKQEQGSTGLNVGNESLDRSVVKKMQARDGGAVPSDLTIELPVYELPELREQTKMVHFALESDFDENGKISFLLLAESDDLALAREEIRDWIMNHLSENIQSDTPEGATAVIAGQPAL